MGAQVVPDQRIRLLAAQESEMIEWTAKRAGTYGVFAHGAFSVMDSMVTDLPKSHMLFAGLGRPSDRSPVRHFSQPCGNTAFR
ncbi:hypothetical protein [Brevundimonas sp.]|uniref:hypothetical protein n=1 Tax=Brevundimonas sp. TaxID=1871086 RepID=UPI0028A2B13C|nr:hypothetical protein [Brevundimonas sp.]